MKTYRDANNERVVDKIFDLTDDMPIYAQRFANEYLVTRNKAPRTVLGYVGDLKVFFRFLEETRGLPPRKVSVDVLASLTADDIQDYMSYLMHYKRTDPNSGRQLRTSNNPPARARKLSSLRALYRYLISHGYLEKNIAELVDMPKIEDKPVTYLEKEEVRDVLHGAETGDALTKREHKLSQKQQRRDVAILTLLLNTGIRVSEMVGIDLRDIDWKGRRISVYRKGRKEQFVYLNPQVVEALRDYIDNGRPVPADVDDLDALFISRKGNRISVRAVERLVRKYTVSTVPPKHITPHKLRSTFATNLYEETGDIYMTSEALGHASLETVKKYTNLSDERRKKAARAIESAYYGDSADELADEKRNETKTEDDKA